MKLLIITQKVDRNDSILGFFHHWIEEFSKHYQKITVICLEKGEYRLPANVRVFSLGKEKLQATSYKLQALKKFKYGFNFFKYIWRERKNYDAVFVHMNQEYVLLGWKFWKLWGKKIFLWRNHRQGNFLTRLAVLFSNKVFCTSPQSFTARFKKTRIMPVGIDTDFFRPDPNVKKIPQSILALGRISSIKHLEILIGALLELQKQKIDFTATIVGSPISPTDQVYEQKLHQLAEPLIRQKLLTFQPAVPHRKTPNIYRSHEIYVNLTPPGSFDKTILEAMACRITVVTFAENNPSNLANKLVSILNRSAIKELEINVSYGREKIKETHTLLILMQKITKEIYA